MTTEKPTLESVSAALTARGVKSLVYNSGGGCMVVTVYPDNVEHETSEGQYEYRYMIGFDPESEADGWGYDEFDAQGDFIDRDTPPRLSGTTTDALADEIAALPRNLGCTGICPNCQWDGPADPKGCADCGGTGKAKP